MGAQPEQPPAEPAPGEPGAGSGSSETAVERFGPLALERLRKDDGRSLIIYSRAEPPR